MKRIEQNRVVEYVVHTMFEAISRLGTVPVLRQATKALSLSLRRAVTQ